jgi:ATP-binding cassette subfamily B protein/subfamily B ATP-binding cassette protein MsbA
MTLLRAPSAPPRGRRRASTPTHALRDTRRARRHRRRHASTGERQPSRRVEYSRALTLVRRHRGDRKVFVVALGFLVLEALTAVIEPLPIAYTIDYLQGAAPSLRERGLSIELGPERFETVLLLGLAIILIAVVNSAADSLAEVFLARGGRVLGYNLRVAMYSKLQRLSLAYHDKRRTGDVLTRVTGDVLVVEEFIVTSVSNLVGSLLVLTGTFAVLLWQSPTVALIALVVVPVLGLVSDYFSRRIKTVSKAQRSREGELASTTSEMLSAIRLVQSYGRGHVDLQRFSTQSDLSMRAALGVATVQAQFSFVVALLEAGTIATVVWLGVVLVDSQTISVGTLVLFVLLIQNMFKPARKIVSEWYKIGKVLASTERIDELLDREPVVSDLPGAVEAPRLTGRLTFDHVTFAYRAESDEPGAPAPPTVLHDISFEVSPGEVVALVGPSGAGKSTIAQLVPRLYDPDAGAVLLDGSDVRRFTLTSLRRQISLVLQDTVLLSGTVAENIAYGVEDADRNLVVGAARHANAHDFITALPEGYDTVLGERGSTLSGGQRQRIAIARAFIRRAPVLVLDEPTTGLDTDATALVLTGLRSLMRGTTTVIISHDLGLIRCADRVLVVLDGRIVQQGAPETLRRVAGPFAELLARADTVGSGLRIPTQVERGTP